MLEAQRLLDMTRSTLSSENSTYLFGPDALRWLSTAYGHTQSADFIATKKAETGRTIKIQSEWWNRSTAATHLGFEIRHESKELEAKLRELGRLNA